MSAKLASLTDDQILEALAEAFTRGYDCGYQQGVDAEKLKWVQRAAKDSQQRILRDLLPTT